MSLSSAHHRWSKRRLGRAKGMILLIAVIMNTYIRRIITGER